MNPISERNNSWSGYLPLGETPNYQDPLFFNPGYTPNTYYKHSITNSPYSLLLLCMAGWFLNYDKWISTWFLGWFSHSLLFGEGIMCHFIEIPSLSCLVLFQAGFHTLYSLVTFYALLLTCFRRSLFLQVFDIEGWLQQTIVTGHF